MDKEWVIKHIGEKDSFGYSKMHLYRREYGDDEDVVWAAIRNDPHDIVYASERLQRNSAIVEYVLQHYSFYVRYLEPDVKIDINILSNALADQIKQEYYLWLPGIYPSVDKLLANDEIMYNVVKIDGECFRSVSDIFGNNEMILFEAIKTWPEAIRYADKRFRTDKKLVLEAVKINGLVLEYLNESEYDEDCPDYQADRGVILEAVKQNPQAINYARRNATDKEIALTVVRINGKMISALPYELMKDPEVILAAINQNLDAYDTIRFNEIKITKEIALTIVRKNGLKLSELGEFRNDRDVVVEAVRQNGKALMCAPDNFKEDFGVVLCALESLSENVKNNKDKFQNAREVYLAAIKNDTIYFDYASSAMRSDKEFIKAAASQNGLVLRNVDSKNIDIDIVKNLVITNLSCLENLSGGIECFLDSKESALELVKCNGMALQYINKNYTSDYDVVLEAVKQNGMAIAYAENNLKWNQEIAMAAIKNNARAIQYTAYTLRKYKPFLLDIIEDNKYIFSYIDKDVIDYEFLLDAVKRNGMVLELYDDKLKKDKNIVLEAVKQNGLALAFAHSSLRKDLEVIEAAITNNQEAASYALRQYSPHVETIPTEQIVELPTVDEELEEIRREGNQKIGFFKQFIKKIRTNPIEEIHNEDMFKTLNAINALPEGILKETLQKDYNDLASHYFKFYKIINNKKMSEIPDLEYTELLQSINNRLSNNKQKDLEINEDAKSVRSI